MIVGILTFQRLFYKVSGVRTLLDHLSQVRSGRFGSQTTVLNWATCSTRRGFDVLDLYIQGASVCSHELFVWTRTVDNSPMCRNFCSSGTLFSISQPIMRLGFPTRLREQKSYNSTPLNKDLFLCSAKKAVINFLYQ